MNVVICDGKSDLRQCLRVLVERSGNSVVGEAENGALAMDLVERTRPDVVVIEAYAKELNGFEFCRRLQQSRLPTQVVVLSLFEDETSVLELFRAGASAHVLKTSANTDLALALRHIDRGRRFLSPASLRHVIDAYQVAKPPKPNLTPKEEELLRLLAWDVSKDEIAKRLSITVEELEESRKQLMVTMNAVNNATFVRYCVRNGLQKN